MVARPPPHWQARSARLFGHARDRLGHRRRARQSSAGRGWTHPGRRAARLPALARDRAPARGAGIGARRSWAGGLPRRHHDRRTGRHFCGPRHRRRPHCRNPGRRLRAEPAAPLHAPRFCRLGRGGKAGPKRRLGQLARDRRLGGPLHSGCPAGRHGLDHHRPRSHRQRGSASVRHDRRGADAVRGTGVYRPDPHQPYGRGRARPVRRRLDAAGLRTFCDHGRRFSCFGRTPGRIGPSPDCRRTGKNHFGLLRPSRADGWPGCRRRAGGGVARLGPLVCRGAAAGDCRCRDAGAVACRLAAATRPLLPQGRVRLSRRAWPAVWGNRASHSPTCLCRPRPRASCSPPARPPWRWHCWPAATDSPSGRSHAPQKCLPWSGRHCA